MKSNFLVTIVLSLGILLMSTKGGEGSWPVQKPTSRCEHCRSNFGVPICGSNGVSYASSCLFRCDEKLFPDLKLAHPGKCHPGVSYDLPEDCSCLFTIGGAVCGDNGETYSSSCEFNCAKKQFPNLKLAYGGTCHPGITGILS